MVCGGIPFYLDQMKAQNTPAQNINEMFFGNTTSLKDEYHTLFASLFNGYARHVIVIKALSGKKKGLQRNELIETSKVKDGGSLTKILNELEESDFIRKYVKPGSTQRNTYYQLTDLFILFHNNFVQNNTMPNDTYWLDKINTPQYYAWAGNAFEIVCINHTNEIKKAMGINGIESSIYAWNNEKTQIDLIIERKDNVVSLIEIKFNDDKLIITKQIAESLRNKKSEVQKLFKPSSKIWITMITTFGLASLNNSDMINNVLLIEDLFN